MKKERIYFDHAATTAVHPQVLESMLPILEHVYGNPSSFYDEGYEPIGIWRAPEQKLLTCWVFQRMRFILPPVVRRLTIGQ